MNFKKPLYFTTILLLFIFSGAARAQQEQTKSEGAVGFLTTEFTYQGKLSEANAAANGNYDFEFKLMDTNGNVLGTIQRTSVPVKSGIFTVRLDFGFAPFNTIDNKFLEIGVRKLASGQFETLAPRQPVTATPIAIIASQALNANFAGFSADSQKLGGIEANGYVGTNDSRLSDARQPTPGSADYIQNSLNEQAANFTINGVGSAGILKAYNVNAQFQYSLNGAKFITAPGIGNTFVGINAGTSWTVGDNNSFFGKSAGQQTTTGRYNSFFGSGAGMENTSGRGNSFFGGESGKSNTEGIQNSFFGSSAGASNTIGEYNAFFGYASGSFNTTGKFNSFFGASSGQANTTGNENSFFGVNAGFSNTTGGSNAFFGTLAGNSNTTGTDNVFIGAGAGAANTTGNENIFIGKNAGGGNPTGAQNIGIGENTSFGANVTNSIAIGNFASAPFSNQVVIGIGQNIVLSGRVQIGIFGSPGTLQLCSNANDQIAHCSSSIRYKKDIENFTPGLELLKKLRPVSFTWKDGGMRDVGFVAEEVAAVEPLLTTQNKNGETEGVKYDRISTALVNAVNEQQTQIDDQQARLKNQQTQIEEQSRLLKLQQEQIEALKKLVCGQNTQAEVCREKEPKK